MWETEGEEQKAAAMELIGAFQVVERVLGEKPYFEGFSFGFVDVAMIPYYSWFHSHETLGDFRIEEECPKLVLWAKEML